MMAQYNWCKRVSDTAPLSTPIRLLLLPHSLRTSSCGRLLIGRTDHGEKYHLPDFSKEIYGKKNPNK